MSRITDLIRAAVTPPDELLPDLKGHDAKIGVLGTIRKMGRDIEDLEIMMSDKYADAQALSQLRDSGAISPKQYVTLMKQLKHR